MGTALLAGLLLRRRPGSTSSNRAVLSSVGEGVATRGPDGRPLRVNPALELLGGRPAAALVGHDGPEAVPLYDRHWRPHQLAAVDRGRSRPRAVNVSAAGTTSTWVAPTAGVCPWPSHGGAPGGGRTAGRRPWSSCGTCPTNGRWTSSSPRWCPPSPRLRTPSTMIEGFSELLLLATTSAYRSRDARSRSTPPRGGWAGHLRPLSVSSGSSPAS